MNLVFLETQFKDTRNSARLREMPQFGSRRSQAHSDPAREKCGALRRPGGDRAQTAAARARSERPGAGSHDEDRHQGHPRSRLEVGRPGKVPWHFVFLWAEIRFLGAWHFWGQL